MLKVLSFYAIISIVATSIQTRNLAKLLKYVISFAEAHYEV
jgi:hypothetical protein